MNPIYSAVRGNGAFNPMQMIQQLRQNPVQFLSRRFRLPNGLPTNDPNAILQSLVSSGQVSQEQINAAYRTAQQMGIRPSGAQTEV